MDHRTEKDTIGKVNVSNEALWGAQTQRSINNLIRDKDIFIFDSLCSLVLGSRSKTVKQTKDKTQGV